ncbi:2-(1,2-epoxy-1,2-dihydrophenyl)acetyl-CoA isomerase [Sphingomonas sp. TDK1]|jgi:2-(1,2-epoxy-1,2-dihydrophenyl)acetyl-CoA isomerase|nr:enoyl-CoA hydratase-related protein [Sphingomonas sp. TDK1]OAN60873.1 2-(1,2-epoxy-1,2-dihydrophenyl)acetyl-CoA isomerase [Sphingomonas sp. TDK1]
MRYEHITLECIEGVATITINRPEVLNALSMQTLDEMMDALDSVAAMGARTLLLRGAGRAFCSGADLSGGVQEDPERIDRGRALETGFNPLLESMVRLPIPIVSAVSGAAAGGGCGIALAADIVIASRSAYFLLPFAAIGLVPDLGVTWLLPRLAGRARASAMMLLGERITADVAADWGLIYKVVDDDDLTTAATAMAARLAAGPTIALGLTRQALSAALNQSLPEALAMERANQRVAGRTVDHAEGIAAFLEKRQPLFRGR